MRNKIQIYLTVLGLLLNMVLVFTPSVNSQVWENEYGRLEVYPDVSTGIITQTQYCTFIPNVTEEVDIAFRFDEPVGNPDIWIWRNISHWVRVPDYGMVEDSFVLVNISDIVVINEPGSVDFGDISSDYYRQGVASYWDSDCMVWFNGSFNIGFDSFEWLNPEHTEAVFYYEYYGITDYHWEDQYWFDWDNGIRNQFSYVSHGSGEYYCIRADVVSGKESLLKWCYDVLLGSDGKWDLLAKKSSDPLGTWRVSIDPWWDSDWGYYKTVEVADKIEGYQMKITIDYDTAQDGSNVSCEGHCQTDFDDIRFVYNNATELPYWIENYTASTQATMWINNTGNYSSFECFYGNGGVSTTGNGTDTFLAWDDFDEGYSVNDVPRADRGWTTTEIDASNYLKTTANPSGSGNVMRRTLANDVKNAWLHNENFASAQEIRIFFKLYGTNTGNLHMYSRAFEGGLAGTKVTTTQYSHLGLGTVKFYDQGETNYEAFVPSLSLTASTWMQMEQRIYKDDYHLVLDGTDGNGETRFAMTDGIDSWECWGQSSQVLTHYIKDFFICKYTTGVEPSWSSFGSEQIYPDTTDPVQGGNATGNLTITWNVTISDNSGSFDWTIECNGQTNSSNGDSNGSKNITLFNLVENTTYTVFVNVTDAASNWNNQTYTFIIGNLSGIDTVTVVLAGGVGVGLAMSLVLSVLFALLFVMMFRRKRRRRE